MPRLCMHRTFGLLLLQVRAVIWIVTDVISKFVQTFQFAVSFPWLHIDLVFEGTMLGRLAGVMLGSVILTVVGAANVMFIVAVGAHIVSILVKAQPILLRLGLLELWWCGSLAEIPLSGTVVTMLVIGAAVGVGTIPVTACRAALGEERAAPFAMTVAVLALVATTRRSVLAIEVLGFEVRAVLETMSCLIAQVASQLELALAWGNTILGIDSVMSTGMLLNYWRGWNGVNR